MLAAGITDIVVWDREGVSPPTTRACRTTRRASPRVRTPARSAATCTTGSAAPTSSWGSARRACSTRSGSRTWPPTPSFRPGQPRPRGRPRRSRQVRRRGRERTLRLPQPDQQRAGLPRRLPRPARRPRQDHPRHAAAPPTRSRAWSATRRSTPTSSSPASSTRRCPRPSRRPSGGGQPSGWQTRPRDDDSRGLHRSRHRRLAGRASRLPRPGRAGRQHRLPVRVAAVRRPRPATPTSATAASPCWASRATSSATRSRARGRDRGVLRDVVRRDVPDVRQDRRQRPRHAPAVRVAQEREKAGVLVGSKITWNFAKFLVGRDGTVIGRYKPLTDPPSCARTSRRPWPPSSRRRPSSARRPPRRPTALRRRSGPVLRAAARSRSRCRSGAELVGVLADAAPDHEQVGRTAFSASGSRP